MTYALIRVAATSSPSLVAGAIAQQIRQQHRSDVRAIGMVAVNQMIKSLIISKNYLHFEKIQLVFVPSFVDVQVDGYTRTAIHVSVRVTNSTQLQELEFTTV